MKGLFKTGLTCFLFLGHFVFGQSLYSFQGLGTLNHQGMPNNVGMGELGIGAPTPWHVNSQNPANLVLNTFSSFQFGIQADSRTFSGENVSGSDFDGGLRFLTYAFPIKVGKWSSSFGILPFSSVSYNTFSAGNVDGDPELEQVINDRGDGGLTHFYWSHGFNVAKHLSLGIRANFTFGSIDKESQISIGGGDVEANTITFNDQTAYSDVNFQFGALYRYPIKETTILNVGAIYSPNSSLNGTNTQDLTRLSGLGNPIETRTVSSTSTGFDLPQTFGLGVSYQKVNKYTFGIDFETQGWKNSSTENQEFRNMTKLVVGGQWTPDYNNVSSYFKRITYRLGFNYLETPYIVNSENINDFGINFGASLPVTGFSSVDLAFKFGQLGTTSNGLIRESYYRVVFGATINDRWFIKRRYD